MQDNSVIKGFSGSVMIISAIGGLVLYCPNVVYEKKIYLFIIILVTLVAAGIVLLCVSIGNNNRDPNISLQNFQCDDYKDLCSAKFDDICYIDASYVPDQYIKKTEPPKTDRFSILKSGEFIVNDLHRQLVIVDDKLANKPVKCEEKFEDDPLQDVDVMSPLIGIKQIRRMREEAKRLK